MFFKKLNLQDLPSENNTVKDGNTTDASTPQVETAPKNVTTTDQSANNSDSTNQTNIDNS